MLLVALPAYAQGPQSLYFPSGGSTPPPRNLPQADVNGVLNVLNYVGADLGAKMNNAVAALPPLGVNGTPRGTIMIPITASPYTLSTTALLPPDVSVICDQGVRIVQTAPIGMDQNVYDATGGPNNEFTSTGGVSNCYFDGVNAPAGAIGIQFGDTNGLTYVDDLFYNYNRNNLGIGMVGVNKQYFTEHSKIQNITFEQDSGGLEFRQQCLAGAAGAQCQNSFEYNWVNNMRCGTYYGVGNAGSNSWCFAVIGGALAAHMFLGIHANLLAASAPGNPSNFHQEVVDMDATSSFIANTLDIHYEDNGNQANLNQDYWFRMIPPNNQFLANTGTVYGGTGTSSSPPGLQPWNNGLTGTSVNLVADPGFRFGSTYWGIAPGWILQPAALAIGSNVAWMQGAGLNLLAVPQ